MATNRKIENLLHNNSHPPAWWLRQYGVVGCTYQDGTLIQNFASPFRDSDIGIGSNSEIAPPAYFDHQAFGLMKWKNKELHVLAYENHQKQSQLNWAADYVNY